MNEWINEYNNGIFNPYDARIDFRRQILASKADPGSERVKYL